MDPTVVCVQIDLHTIPNLKIPKISLEKEFDILQVVGEGWFAKLFLVEHRKTRSEIVLKAIHKDSIEKKDLVTEFHYGYHLAALNSGKNITKVYDILFESDDCYIYASEYATYGDLTNNLSEIGIGELYTKRVARQVASALDFMHDNELVHRDVQLGNILIFKSDFSRVKLSDFGECKRRGAYVVRFNEWVPYSPPEIVDCPQGRRYSAEFSVDTWQYGILLFMCLTGSSPWQKADKISDPNYAQFELWTRSNFMKAPKLFKILSNRVRRLFRKLLDPDLKKRVAGQLTEEVAKYIEDKWLIKLPVKQDIDEDLSTSMSMFSFHSSLTDKNRLLGTLTRFGVETTVDRNLKKDRIKEWVTASTIVEDEDTEDESVHEERKSEKTTYTSSSANSSSNKF